jgi:hypothetical protein
MTPQDVHARLDALLQQHFPDDPSDAVSSWNQPNYKIDLYRLACDAYMIQTADDIQQYLRDYWIRHPFRTLDENDEAQLHNIVIAWGAWQFGLLVQSGYFETPEEPD